jgi:hypothetical protein
MSDLNITPSSTWSAKLPAGAAVFKIIKVNNHFGKATMLKGCDCGPATGLPHNMGTPNCLKPRSEN